MSESESEGEFLQVFANKRNQRTSSYNKNLTTESTNDATTSVGVALRPPERKIASAQRQHQRAVKTILKQNDMQRNVALSGMDAHRQSLRNRVVVSGDDTSSIQPASSNSNAASSSSSSNAASITHAVAKEATLEDATNRANLIQDEKNNFNDNDKIVAWTTVRSIAEKILNDPTKSLKEKNDAFYAILAALTREGDAHTRLEQLRSAIKAYETVYSRSKIIDSITPNIKTSLFYVLTQLSNLYSDTGNIDKLRITLNRIAELEKKGSGEATKQTDDNSKKPNTVETKKSTKETSKPTLPKQETTKEVSTPAPSTTVVVNTPAPPPVVEVNPVLPAPTLVKPEIPELDGTPQTLFTRAAYLAMFDQNFEEINLILNRGLFNEPEAITAIKQCALPETNINLFIICAAQGRADLIQRILGFYKLSEQYHLICQYTDNNGNNSIAHASLLQRHEALHELLCALHATNPKYTSYTPADTNIQDIASLPDLGLRLEQAKAFNIEIQEILRSFLRNPTEYVKAANDAMKRSGIQPPLPPPLPNSPPLPMNTNPWNTPLSNAQAYQLRDQMNRAYALFFQQQQLFMRNLMMNMNKLNLGAPPPLPPTTNVTSATTTTATSPEKSTNSEWEKVGRNNNKQQKQKNNRKNNNNSNSNSNNNNAPKDSTLLDFLPSNVSKEAGQGKLVGRKLQSMELPPEEDTTTTSTNNGKKVTANELLEETDKKGKKGKKWDQFAANQSLFGINAQYDESAYTTILDTSKFSKEQITAAEKLAAEILAAEDSNNPHIRAERGQTIEGEEELDEEALHSAVLGTTKSKDNTNTGKDSFTDAGVAKKSSKGKK